jgi:hypothetical protein
MDGCNNQLEKLEEIMMQDIANQVVVSVVLSVISSYADIYQLYGKTEIF